MVSDQQKANSAMCAVAITTTLHCASKRDPGKTDSKEAISPTSTSQAMDITSSTPHVGTTAEAIACTVIPGPHPTAPHEDLPVAHPKGAPLIPKGTSHPTSTSRTL